MTEPECTPGASADGQRTNRRAFLSLAGATAAIGLAGCLGGSDGSGPGDGDGTDTGGGSSGDGGSGADGPFSDVAFDEGELKVTLERDGVATVNAFRDGEEIGSTDVSTGAEKATVFAASQTYHGEEIRLVAVDGDGNEIGETTASFAAQPEITQIRTQAMKNDREATERNATVYTREFATALLTIENTGDGPLLFGTWKYNYDGTTVFFTDGVPQTVGSEKRSSLDDPNERVFVPAGGSVEVKPYVPTDQHLNFKTPDGEEPEEWPESVRSMGEFPDGYADGDEVDVTATIVDDTGEELEATVTATYDGGLIQTLERGNRAAYVPAEFSAGE